MYLVTLAEVRKHLNEPLEEDNDYISELINVSYYSIKNKCGNTTWVDHSGNTTGSIETPTLEGVDIPLVIKHAILLMVGHLYSNREPISFGNPQPIPYTIEYLIAPYINY